jgi:hypothetical protein
MLLAFEYRCLPLAACPVPLPMKLKPIFLFTVYRLLDESQIHHAR